MENKPLAQVYSAALDSKAPASATKGGGLAGGLRELLGAVEAGEGDGLKLLAVRALDPHEEENWWRLVLVAFNGDLNAAKALHEAVLPGWYWCLQFTMSNGEAYVGADGKPLFEAENDNPARAWLIAILKALIAETGDDT